MKLLQQQKEEATNILGSSSGHLIRLDKTMQFDNETKSFISGDN